MRSLWRIAGALLVLLAGSWWTQNIGNTASPRWVLQTIDGRPIQLHRSSPGFQSATVWAGALPDPMTSEGEFRPSLELRVRAFTHVIATLLHCNDEAVRLELHYVNLLQQATRYRTRNGHLYLFDDTHPRPRLVFETAPAPASPFTAAAASPLPSSM
ncbi:hypothetical protein [Hymenobacter sp. BT730]|uniref:hypothetical protein n=1 Tax=Hymenobacter sp. BT730 TaxID=3063332 RepID=UPI0026DFDEA6|nr:hypothetical protein [Hymenobacter sp. BT730]